MANGKMILANTSFWERNDKKRACTKCNTKLIDGVMVIVVRNPKGKPRAYLCDDDCQKSYAHEYLERNGFYEGIEAVNEM